jgi:DNA-binding transcriptional ArsR family regulator
VLSDAGLVVTRRDGTRRMYRARPEGLADAWDYINEMWPDRLSRLKSAAEREQRRMDARSRRQRRERP